MGHRMAPRKTAVRKTSVKKKAVKPAATPETAAAPPARKDADESAACPATTADPTTAEGGAELIDRVMRAVDRELAEIESIVGTLRRKSRPTEAERRARTLASLTRTLSEVRRLRVADEMQMPDDAERPRDLEELRQRLSQRLARMVEAGEPPATDGIADA